MDVHWLPAAIGGAAFGLAVGWIAFGAPGRGPDVPPDPPIDEIAPRPRPDVDVGPSSGRGDGGATSGEAASSRGRVVEALPPVPSEAVETAPRLTGVAPGSADRAPLYDMETFRAHLIEEHRRMTGRGIAADYLEQALEEAEHAYRTAPAATASRWAAREKVRAAVGEIGEPVDLLLQIRGDSGRGVSILGGDESHPPEARSPSPLAVTPVARDEKPSYFVRGGVVPVKKLLVVERVHLRAALGSGRREGGFDAGWGDRVVVHRRHGVLAGTFEGVAAVRPFAEQIVRLSGQAAAVEMRVEGRLVDEGTPVESRPFLLSSGPSEGYITRGPIRLQVLSGVRGQGSVHLDGSTSPQQPAIDLSPRDVWGRTVADTVTTVHAGDAGLVPPRRVLRVERVTWRARFEGSKGRLDVRLPGAKNLSSNQQQQGATQGEWTKPFVVGPGDEQSVRVTASGGAVVDVEIHGNLVAK